MKVYYQSPIGTILIKTGETGIQRLIYIDENEMVSQRILPKNLNEMTSQCIRQLDEYFSGKRHDFDLPLDLQGTPFQKRVWEELLKIPYGTTISYKELAIRLGDVKAIRAVGTANGANHINIIVPCHRVIGSDGKLVGYGGGLWRKKWLLEHEKLPVVNCQLSIFDSQT